MPQLETIESILMPHSNVLNEKKAEFPLIDIDDVNLIWVGDSRTVGMKAHLQNDDTYICKSSMGLSWLQDTAIHTLKEKVQDNSIIIFNLGINDLYKLNQYVEYYNKIPEMFPNNMIVFMSVNPIDESQFEYIKNSKVKEFNETLEASFTDIVYIDTCTYLLENGFESFDGVHYGPSTSKDIRDFVINNLENMTIFRKKS